MSLSLCAQYLKLSLSFARAQTQTSLLRRVRTKHLFSLSLYLIYTHTYNSISLIIIIMRERSESRERNDDWNRDDVDDRMRERRNEEEKIPVWTRRRPTGFDVMPEGEQREVYVLVGFFFMIIPLSLSIENSFDWFCALCTAFGGFVSFLFSFSICMRDAC